MIINDPPAEGKPDAREATAARRAAPRRVTMTDVARAAGCSQATVSFVLNRAPGVRISDDMRARVIEAARALHYATADLAHRAPGPPIGDGFTGFIVDQLGTSPEAVVAIDGARSALDVTGGIVMVAQTLNDPETEARTVRMMVEKGAGALIYMTIFTRQVTLPGWATDLGVPMALLNCYTGDGAFPAVVPAEAAAGQRATRHLLDMGHRRIATITGEPWMEATRDRLAGYRRALSLAGIDPDPALVRKGNWAASSGFEQTRRLLAMDAPPTAIFCQNDRMAIGCYEALKEAGLRIPEDMSVIGFDDEEISRHLHPQLTTLVLPQRAMGVWAVSHLGSAGGSHRLVKLDCRLIERQSVAPLRA